MTWPVGQQRASFSREHLAFDPVFIIPREWQVQMQDQFDAVLYLGETATWTFQAPGDGQAR